MARGRPRLPDDELKNPRKQKKSTVDGPILTDKKPSFRVMKRYGPIMNRCIDIILAAPARTDNKVVASRIEIVHKKPWRKLEGWPIGRRVRQDDNVEVISYNVDKVLLWGYQYGITDKSPRMLYALRSRHLAGVETMMKNLLELREFGM